MWAFNPPPGWPVPPGFVPPAGWQPDPSWPLAPDGWDYWVPAAAPADVPDAPPPTGSPVSGSPAYPPTAYPAAAYPPDPQAPYGYPGYPQGPYSPYGVAPKKSGGFPTWGIVLIVVGVLSVIGSVIVAAAVFAGIAFNGVIGDLVADEAAATACDTVEPVLDRLPSAPDPRYASELSDALAYGISGLEDAQLFDDDDAYRELSGLLDDAMTQTDVIDELPADASTWTAAQQADAEAAWDELKSLRDQIQDSCYDVPSFDDTSDPSV